MDTQQDKFSPSDSFWKIPFLLTPIQFIMKNNLKKTNLTFLKGKKLGIFLNYGDKLT